MGSYGLDEMVNHGMFPFDGRREMWWTDVVMKLSDILTLGVVAVGITSCGSLGSLNQPLSGNSDFDPLSAPGSGRVGGTATPALSSPSYRAGQWVETAMPNTTFFRKIPKGNASADRVLAAGTPMKVVASSGTYVKVELDSGDVGYVPEIMVIERSGNEVPVNSSAPPPPPVDLGAVPPPVDPNDTGLDTVPPPPPIPGTPPPVPEIPGLPEPPPIPGNELVVPPPIPPTVPTVPDVAPPPEDPGIVDPDEVGNE